MRRPRKKHLWVLLIMGALVSPFVFFSTPMTPWRTNHSSLLIWHELLFPFQYTWYLATHSIVTTWRQYVDLQGAASENEVLRRQLATLQTRIMDYEHQVQEASRLRNLLGFAQQYQRGMSVGEVIGISSGTPFQSIRIAKGSLDSLRVGMPIVAAQGIVGRVLRAGLKFADVQLLSDASFNVDVLVERTRTRGVLHGIGNNRCRLQLHRRADIKIGDTMITSGVAGGFPKGLPVGRVTKISYESDDVSQVITIQPWVDYHQLEEVVILDHVGNGIETIEETAGADWIDATINQERSAGG